MTSTLRVELARAARTADSVAGLLRLAVEAVCRDGGWPVGHAYVPPPSRAPEQSTRGRAPTVVPTDIWHLEDPDRHRAWRRTARTVRDEGREWIGDRVARSGEPEWIGDPTGTDEPSGTEEPPGSPDEIPVRMVLAVPLLSADGVVAVLEFYHEELGCVDDAALERFRELGHYLGWALELKEWEMDSRDSRLRLRMIVEAMQDIASAGVDPDAVMDATARRSMELTGASSAGIYLVAEDDPGQMVLHAGVGNAEPYVGDRFSIGDTLSGYAFRSGEVLHSSDALGDSRVNQEIIRSSGIRSLIAVPLKSDDGGTVGLLNVMSNRSGCFDLEDVQLLRLLSQHMGSSLDRARAFRANVRLLDDLVRTAGKLEETLKQREAILDASLHPILALDAEVRVTAWSRAAEELYGWTEEEVLGRPLPILPESRREEVLANIARVREGETLHNLDVVHQRKDGSPVHVRLSAAPIPTEEGDSHVVAVITDRSEMKRVEARLMRAERMEAIGRLAGGVAHDFNNMLTAIQGHADLLRTGRLTREQEESVEDIGRAVERSAHITQQLLAYSRRQTLEARIVYPSDAIQEMSGLLDRLLGERIRLSLDLEPEAGPILVDPARLDQVVMNLVVNAREAVPRGGEIRVTCAQVEVGPDELEEIDGIEAGPSVRISVYDDGEGIPPEVRGRIFEPFFSTKEPGRGTGLGLATVYGVVYQSGGTIQVESTPGEGSAFHVYFPVSDRHEGDDEEEDVEGEGPQILLVEEMDIVERLIRRILEPMGYRVRGVHSHTAALETLSEEGAGPDLLVTDASRGHIAFRRFHEAIREIRTGIPILVLTDEPFPEDDRMEEGVTRIQKPFSPQTLERAISRLLAGRSHSR